MYITPTNPAPIFGLGKIEWLPLSPADSEIGFAVKG